MLWMKLLTAPSCHIAVGYQESLRAPPFVAPFKVDRHGSSMATFFLLGQVYQRYRTNPAQCHKVDTRKMVKVNWFWQERVVWSLCDFFKRWSRRNDEECKLFRNSFLVNKYLHFFKEVSMSNPLFYTTISLVEGLK